MADQSAPLGLGGAQLINDVRLFLQRQIGGVMHKSHLALISL